MAVIDRFHIATATDFQQRVAAALVQRALVVLDGAPDDAFALQILLDPSKWAPRISLGVAMYKGDLDKEVDEDTLLATVEAVWGRYAKAAAAATPAVAADAKVP